VDSRRNEMVGSFRMLRWCLQFVIVSAPSWAMFRDYEQGDLDSLVSYGLGMAHNLDDAEQDPWLIQPRSDGANPH